MNQDIRDRLRRLGVHKGVGQVKPTDTRERRFYEREEGAPAQAPAGERLAGEKPAPTRVTAVGPPIDPHAPLWNLELATNGGRALVRRTQFPLNHQHGEYELARA